MKIAFFLFFSLITPLLATPDDDWNAILAMDAGPTKKPASTAEARTLGKAHFAKHQALIEDFLKKNPVDLRGFEARLRLASILAATGKMEKKQSLVDDAMRMLQTLEKDKSAPLDKRADAGFRRVSLYMQCLDSRENESRRDIVTAARNFQTRYPNDRRTPRLLVEVATICDNAPDLKRELLDAALASSPDEVLKRRIADDLKRIALLGKPLPLRLNTIQGRSIDLANQEGRIVFLIFWAADSAPSLLWMQNFQLALANLPVDRFSIITVSLDKDPALPMERLKDMGMSQWATSCDGLGWDGPLARQCGINSLPTVLLLDQAGVVRAINVRGSYESWIRKLLMQPAS
ncbi:MAG: TlpA disulfide reductase family protein [Verrucomicrobia bacterium]|nr:TlpA disulfide reductase family protein [Verrucomicrobiota bacterium]